MRYPNCCCLVFSAGETYSHFVLLALSDVDGMLLATPSDNQSEDVGSTDHARNFEPRPESRSIADRAIDHSSTIEHSLPG